MHDADYETLPDTIKQLLHRETTNVELKQNYKEISAEYFVAFANANGGVILAGISPDRSISGCRQSDDEIRRTLFSRADSCRASIATLIDIEEIITGSGKRIYKVSIKEGWDKPYCTSSGEYKIRDDAHNRPLFPEEIRRIVLQKSGLKQDFKQLERRLARTEDENRNLLKKIEDSRRDSINQISKSVRGIG